MATDEAALRELGGATLKRIAMELTTNLRKSVTVDWAKRDIVSAKRLIMSKTLLRRYKEALLWSTATRADCWSLMNFDGKEPKSPLGYEEGETCWSPISMR